MGILSFSVLLSENFFHQLLIQEIFTGYKKVHSLNFMYLFISIVCLIFGAYLFNKYGASLRLSEFNFCTYIFFYEFVAQSFIASLLVIYKLDNHYIISRVGDEARFWGWISVQWAIVGTGIGLFLGRFITREKKSALRFRLYTKLPIATFSDNYEYCIRVTLIGLSILSLLATVYYSLLIGGISLFKVLRNPALMTSTLRIDASRNFGGNEYIKNMFSINLSPILAYIWYAYKKRHNTFSNTCWFLIMTCNAVIALTNNLAKSPVFWFFLRYLFLYVLVNSVIKRKYLYLAGGVTLCLMIAVYVFLLKLPIETIFRINSGIMGRIFLSQSAGTYCSFEYFPSIHNYLGFSSFSSWFTTLFGIEHSERSARICMEIFNPKGVADGVAGVMNSLFIAEAWANWGLIGVLIAPLIVGIFIHVLFFSLIKLPKHPIVIGFVTYFCTAIPITGGINDFVYPVSIVLMIVILYLLFYFAQFFRRASS